MKKLWLIFVLLGISHTVFANQKKSEWIMYDQDEYGWFYLDQNATQVTDADPNIIQIGHKYIYRYGVPSLKIQPKGYVQAIHQINCKDKTRAYIKSQRFTPKGIPLDKEGAFSTVYFEPMNQALPNNIKLLRTICANN